MNTPAVDVDTVVIGAGVVGLAIAAECARPGRDVLVLERHDRIGAETSSRNSEVIHAGLYYTPGSLKARLCVEGRERLYRFATDNGVTAIRCGKLLVAVEQDEIAALEHIAATAATNGVTDLQRLTAPQARALEPHIDCVAALYSPSTGIVDSHALMLALEGHLTAAGGQVVLDTTVTGLARTPGGGAFRIATLGRDGASAITARRLVVAAGLQASDVARLMTPRNGYEPPVTHFAKGHYFTLAGRAPFRHLVYPMPSGGGLGVHLTLDTAGAARFGPDIEWHDRVSYEFEDADGARRAAFEAAIRRFWPALPEDALQPGYTGIRPKLTRPRAPAADFAIHGAETHGIANFVALYGIESPGLTSALAIAAHVARLIG